MLLLVSEAATQVRIQPTVPSFPIPSVETGTQREKWNITCRDLPKAASGTATRVQNRDRPPPLFSSYPWSTHAHCTAAGGETRQADASARGGRGRAGASGPGREPMVHYAQELSLNTAGSEQCQGHGPRRGILFQGYKSLFSPSTR